MISKEIITAQLDLYRKGQKQALEVLEKAKADVSAFSGAIEACTNFLRIEDELVAGQSAESSEEAKPK